jgi:hypothetical protein
VQSLCSSHAATFALSSKGPFIYSLLHGHDGDLESFRKRAIAALLACIGRPYGFALGLGHFGSTDGFAGLGALGPGTRHTGEHALADHVALEFGKCSAHLEHQLACRRRGIDVLLMRVQADLLDVQMFEKMQEIPTP